MELTQKARPGFDKHDPRGTRVDRSEIRRKSAFCQFGNGSGQLDPRRPAADDHEVQQSAPLVGICLGFGLFEREQNSVTQVDRIADCLLAVGMRRPVVVSEIGLLRAGCDDQVVERYPVAPSRTK